MSQTDLLDAVFMTLTDLTTLCNGRKKRTVAKPLYNCVATVKDHPAILAEKVVDKTVVF